MKEFALKHPILTFLLASTLVSEVLGTIRAFAPGKAEAEEKDTENCEVTIETGEEEKE